MALASTEPGDAPVGPLLLVELAVDRRFQRGVCFPFVFAWAKEQGIAVRWVRYGLPAAGVGVVDGGGAGPGRDDLEALAGITRGLVPARIMLSHMPPPPMLATLHAAAPRARIAWVMCGAGDEESRRVLGERGLEAFDVASDDLGELVGRPDPRVRGAGLFERTTPDYGFEAGNPLAARIDPMPFVVIGNECTYSAPIARNSFLDGVDTRICVRRGGCSFCTRPESADRWDEDPLELMERQLSAVARTCPRTSGPLCVRIVGENAVRNADRLAALTARLFTEPMGLLLDSRADKLIEHKDVLRRGLVALAGTGHRLHLSLIGIESFSSAELERLNKGLDAATNLRAIRTLFELEREHPETFGFREHGGLSVITFTPWTRPEELDLNLTVVRTAGVAQMAGKLLGGRLRLYGPLPLTQVARRDGLLRKSYDDPLLDTARQGFYEAEIPWTFRDPVMEPINRILCRMGDELAADEDQLMGDARKLVIHAQERRGLDIVALAALVTRTAMSVASTTDEPVTAEGLLDAVRARIDEDVAKGPADERLQRHATTFDAALQGRIGTMTVDRLLDLKPVIKVEPLREAEARTFEQDARLPHVRVRRRVAPAGAPGLWEAFVGRHVADVERAVACTETIHAPASREDWAKAATDVGRLLGYPDCCIRAHVDDGSPLSEHHGWLTVARRVAAGGTVPFELNPGCDTVIDHVPCALTCEPTLERARTMLAALASEPATERRLLQRLSNPHVLLLEQQDTFVELVPEHEPSERFRYRAGAQRGVGEDLRALVAGDELVLEPECTVVLRGGRATASLSGRAFVWWHRRTFQTAFWSALTDLLRAAPETPIHLGEGALPANAPAWMVVVSRLLTQFRESGTPFDGFVTKSWWAPTRDQLCVELSSAWERISLAVEALGPGVRVLHTAGRLGVSHPPDRPLDTATKWSAAASFARELGQQTGGSGEVSTAALLDSGAGEERSVAKAASRRRVLLVGAFRSMVNEGADGPFGGQGGFVDTLAPEPYSLANGYLKALVDADPELSAQNHVGLLDLAQPLGLEDADEEVTLTPADLDRILEREPDIVGFSSYCWNVDAVRWAAAELTRRRPSLRILVGGRATEGDPEELLASMPGVEALVLGEGELAFLDILRSDGGDLGSIPGLVIRTPSGDIRSTGPARMVEDLDTLPSPFLTGALAPAPNAIMLELSRGCVHACGYCTWNADKRRRVFGPARVEAEVRGLIAQGHRHVTVTDSAINYETRALAETVEAIGRADPGGLVRFTYNVRHDEVTNEQLAHLARLPTHQVLLGIETLEPHGMADLGRTAVDPERLASTLDALSRAVRPPVVSIVLGLPRDTEAGFMRTLDTLLGWTRDRAGASPRVGTVLVSLLQVYRGSGLWQQRERLGLRVQERGIPYLLESPAWSAKALARVKAHLVARMADDQRVLKAAEAIVLMESRGGVSPWHTTRRIADVLAGWPVGTDLDGWTLEKIGLQRDSGRGVLVRFRWQDGGGHRLRFERRERDRPAQLLSRYYAIDTDALPGPQPPREAVRALEEQVLEVLGEGEQALASRAAEARRRIEGRDG